MRSGDPLWLFGYGSLIWRPDFIHVERRLATARGWTRRFWQGSTDHRGTPGAPGRVVTLVAEAGAACVGMAYRLDPLVAEPTLRALDHREKDGYERVRLALRLDDGRDADALTWIAPPANSSWLGEAPMADIARQIGAASGPSGSNADYLWSLAAHLEELGVVDGHVAELARLVAA